MFRPLPALGAAVAVLALSACANTPTESLHIPRQPAPVTGTARIEIKPFTPEPRPKVTLDKVLPKDHSPARAVDVAGIQLVPIHAAETRSETEYLTLDEAIKSGVCKVNELDQGTVDTLVVSNNGDKPIFVMAGDLVLGGKQDRVVAASLVVEPRTEQFKVKAFCVEHGRWQALGGSMSFDNDATRGQVDVAVKRAAVGSKDQSAVWRAVAINNASLGVQADGGSFRATYDSEKVAGQLDDAMKAAAPARDGKAVGYAVLLESEVVAMDLFESSGLCSKLSEKLLRSYLISALTGGYNRPEDHPLVAPLQDRASVEFIAMPLAQAVTELDKAWGAKLEFSSRHHNPYITFKVTDRTMAEVIDALCAEYHLGMTAGEDATVRCSWYGEYRADQTERQRAILHRARELFEQLRFIAARDFLRQCSEEFAWSPGLARAADACQECFEFGVTAQRADAFQAACADAWTPRRGRRFGTGNDAGFFFEDVQMGWEDWAGGQFDNGTAGIAPSNPTSGIFFNNQDPNNPPVYFNQDIRGRFNHDQAAYAVLGDTPLVGRLFRRGSPTSATSLVVGTPTTEQDPIEHACQDEKRANTVHRGYMRR